MMQSVPFYLADHCLGLIVPKRKAGYTANQLAVYPALQSHSYTDTQLYTKKYGNHQIKEE